MGWVRVGNWLVVSLMGAGGVAGSASTGCSSGEPAVDVADGVAAEAVVVDDAQLDTVLAGRLRPLASVAVPRPVGGDVVDELAAARLGKAFFWDVQAGSDGQTACATCHYRGGADDRRFNSVAPGPNRRFGSLGVTAPDQLARVGNIGTDDRSGSQGVVAATFLGFSPDPAVASDVCTPAVDPVFGTSRQVTDRNTPTVIGAALQRTLFWDGRASGTFNGRDPFGQTPNADPAGALGGVVEAAALASQATGPAGNAVEMSCAGRGLNGPSGVGAKLLARSPLARQTVDPTDSLLGALSAAPDMGLRCGNRPCTYRELIGQAFGPVVAADAESRFSRIWGQAVAAYESRLIPDDTPLDRWLAGDHGALSLAQKGGLLFFATAGGCIHCHAGPELSDASWTFAAEHGLVNEDGGDQGFHHIGVRPTSTLHSEDLGRAGLGPRGATFSLTRSNADRGAFKTPMLRNVKLTAPYFHNGGKGTLDAVLDFYAQGGDFRGTARRMRAFVLPPVARAALKDFLENGLTDCRVEKERAPFDHPSLAVPDGPDIAAVGAAGHGSCFSL